uniref:Podoplanin n=1 Tax=Homo sapiens TaxID=9606 RepID=D6RH07_HUMAN
MPGAEDDVVTPGTSEDRYKSGLTTLRKWMETHRQQLRKMVCQQ